MVLSLYPGPWVTDRETWHVPQTGTAFPDVKIGLIVCKGIVVEKESASGLQGGASGLNFLFFSLILICECTQPTSLDDVSDLVSYARDEVHGPPGC